MTEEDPSEDQGSSEEDPEVHTVEEGESPNTKDAPMDNSRVLAMVAEAELNIIRLSIMKGNLL